MKRDIKSLVILATLSLFTVSIIYTFVLLQVPSSGGPQDFYETSRNVSLNETINVANQYNLSLYLPSELPDDFECTAIYLKDGPFIVIVVYSAEDIVDYKTAELVIQITP